MYSGDRADSSAGSLPSVQHRGVTHGAGGGAGAGAGRGLFGDSAAGRECNTFERPFFDRPSPGGKQRDVAAHLAAFYSKFAPEKLKDVQAIVSDFRWVERECLPWRRHAP